MERDQYDAIIFRLVTIALEIKTFTEQQTQINERLTQLVESLLPRQPNGQADTPQA